ncbi:MAG: rubrerythrin family protein [Thermosulfidibacteraceae bacterium]|jgi:rubrerythrin
MRKMTKEFLMHAFAGESQAHMKYLIFSDKAEQQGYKNVARLFRAIAYAEFVHARNHLELLNGKDVLDNLETAIEGETFEVEEMYPAYKATAQLQGEKGAERSFNFALEAEKIHAALYQEAMEAVKAGKDFDVKSIYICPVCGYTVTNEAPDRCPICGLKSENFKQF